MDMRSTTKPKGNKQEGALSNTKPTTSLSDLQKSLRLPGEAEMLALLKTDQLKEAFRLYRNRCLVSQHMKAVDLPDWKEVDGWLYELKLDPELRRYLRTAISTSPSTPTTTNGEDGKGNVKGGVKLGMKTIDDYLARVCHDKPYELMPHVAMFVLRVGGFLKSELGEEFDVGREDGRGVSNGGERSEGSKRRREREFDRALRIMRILQSLVARDIG
ncbi:hypothetical protein HD806DRAFT_539524 [Xylariaceae sp. AK1471]|nr:hypothetical protein HD806DRAFT_539524 [Xylariaceae sp. AK1471]